ncbi:MAG: FISUMP domain-containing protein, partial [Bacteroidota bacterium]
INTTPVVSTSHIQEYTIPTPSPLIRFLRFSRDGTKLVAIYDTVAEFCSFNSTTGQITPKFLVMLPFCGFVHIRPKSAEFSIDSRYLYISGTGNGGCTTSYAYLYQFDASLNDSAQFENSMVLLTHEVNTPGLQMATNGKIYCSSGSIDSLSVINNPSVQGLGCNYQRDVVGLGGRSSGTTLPDFVERYYAIIHHTGDCVGQLVSFNPAIWPPVDSIHWEFGEPASGGSNFSNLQNATHAYSTTGTYTVKMFVRHNDHRIDSAQQQITIVPGLQVNAGPNQIVCPGDSATFDAGSCAGCSYVWRDESSGIIVWSSRVFKTNQPGGYIVTVTDPNGCPGKDTVHVTNTQVPVITNIPLSKTICSGESTGINLLSTVPGTFFLWTGALTSGTVTGFSADSGTIINQTLINNGVLPGIVTYHITPRVGNCYGNAVNFPVTVNPGATVSITINSSAMNVCAGTLVTFTAFPMNGGTSPSFQWKVNGIDAGTNNSTFSYNPLNGDGVSCVLTSSQTSCIAGNPALSNSITMVVNMGAQAVITIVATPNPFCPGSSVTFTATPVSGGTAPSYQWKVNGMNAGANSSTFIYNPAPNDSVRCLMTSNLACVSGNPATSNKIIMDGSLAPYVSFVACFDTITTTNAKPIKLKGGIPLGGTYSGAGVSVGYYHPNVAGAGTHLITYTYTNSVPCSAHAHKSLFTFSSSLFTCGISLLDPRDNKTYPTIKIGSQCWFAANLNYGIEIPSTQHQRDNCVNEKYLNPAASSQQPAAAYQWDEVMKYDNTPGLQGLCPPSWHVPTETEWNTLFSFYINNGFAGSPLKYSGYSGFNALLSGVNHLNSQWDFNDFATFFWSSTPYGPYKAWAHGMNDDDPSVSVYPSSRANAFSVRCLHD